MGCQGDCDDDKDCAGDLHCYSREAGDVMPGCIGVPKEGYDYCSHECKYHGRRRGVAPQCPNGYVAGDWSSLDSGSCCKEVCSSFTTEDSCPARCLWTGSTCKASSWLRNSDAYCSNYNVNFTQFESLESCRSSGLRICTWDCVPKDYRGLPTCQQKS